MVRRELVRNRVPTVPGGGTVAFVDPVGHRYLDDPVAREEGGTPAIVESIRAGLVVRPQAGRRRRRDPGPRGAAVARGRCAAGRPQPGHRDPRQPATRAGCRSCRSGSAAAAAYLHHNFVVALLNDLFGIQARGGCSCAGPYGHRLLGIDPERSRGVPGSRSPCGCEGIKPGWTRINFNYFISDAGRRLPDRRGRPDRPRTGTGCCPTTASTPRTGLWRHHRGPGPPLRLAELARLFTDADQPALQRRWAGEDALAGHLHEAREILAGRGDHVDEGPTGLPAGFEALRWFHLPPACTVSLDAPSSH